MKSLLLWNFKAAFSWKGLEFQDFRAYSYGDDAKYIDWWTSSREGTTVIRRYREEKEAHILCIADMTASLNFWDTLKQTLMQEVIELLWEVSLGSGESFGWYKLFQTKKEYIVPKKSSLSLYEFQKNNKTPLRDISKPLSLDFLLKNPLKRSIVFVLSDTLLLDDVSFKIAAQKHDIIFISLASHFENTLEGEWISLLRWKTGSRWINLDDLEKKKLYQEERKKMQKEFQTKLQKWKIESIFLDETSSLFSEFLALMQRREHKKR